MSSEYHTLSFIQLPVHRGTISAEVVNNGSEVCYRIETFQDAVHLYHKGPLAGKRPIAVFKNLAGVGAGGIPSVAFRDKEEQPAGFLLTTHSRTRKVLRSGTAHYEWVLAANEQRLWYEIKNPLDDDLPFARLVVGMGAVFLELSTDICLCSDMCDGVVAAVVLMCLMRDAWLGGASLRLQ
ncbi:hypothetical protein HYPSUDRAFT_209262 [Hypholoma sublateritium FD-334 SS-4]|uniref:Uncharacterized protein n=1 Tax=Hypholoma sublateritium (strain FD-334 SS-4) TaxID=945553 RepID=A0A0D2NB42_HYPSF|nr:hypothetical protein HYPSUDRAFT_209262 [Hypholoma sublateritium FD-334 SS-4]